MSVEAGPRPSMGGQSQQGAQQEAQQQPQPPRWASRTTATGKERRVSRACVSCRLRKTRCDLDYGGNPGNPPCRRCVREQKECILATSRRGGRRPRKCVRLPDGEVFPPPGTTATFEARPGSADQKPAPASRQQTDHSWPHSSEDEAADDDEHEHPTAPNRPASWPASSTTQSPGGRSLKSSGDIEGHITSSDLLNPSDALNLLAQVADLDGEGARKPSEGRPASREDAESAAQTTSYPPISDGVLPLSVASRLLKSYNENYHPFFPVADKCILSPPSIPRLAEAEPHLLTAILTVASKDEPSLSAVHEACSRHMEALISKLIYKGSTTVGAVEALLILAQWAPQRLQERPTVGRGEEDEGAWMQIGVAIRLGYLQSLEQTGLLVDKQSCLSEQFRRKRMVWAACYMSDREVSIRVGKGFWSRGPGPSTIPRSADFPSLRVQRAGPDDLGQLFQAQLELIQLFSNAHDILYSSASHRAQLYLGGEYVRYIDDSFAVLRKWKLVWGSLSFTPLIKAALDLSYEFLRLYINAFAFQATINRAITRARQQQQQQQAQQQQQYQASPPQQQQTSETAQHQQQQQHQQTPAQTAAAAGQPRTTTAAINSPLFSDLFSTPDARFIYESMDAANSLLNILNTAVDPAAGLRYMPLKYYLYVIYAAVFLFKARLAGALGAEASDSVRRSVSVTVDCLQRSSVGAHSLGQRYARLLSLLWRNRTPEPSQPQPQQRSPQQHEQQNQQHQQQQQRPSFTGAADGTTASRGAEVGLIPVPPASAPAPSAEHQPQQQHHLHHPHHHPTGFSSTTNTTHDGENLLLNSGHIHSHLHLQTHTHTATTTNNPLAGMPSAAAELQLCRAGGGFSWRDLDDLGQFIGAGGPAADDGMGSFSADPTGLQHVVGNIALDEAGAATAYDVLWPGGDVVF